MKKRIKTNWNGRKTLNKYNCGYYKNEFEQWVGTGSSTGGGKKGKVSSQVSCPKCGNFLKTWD